MKKKIFTFALACTMAIGLFPITALADDSEKEISLMAMDFREVKSNQQGDNWEWDASAKTLTLNNFHGVVNEGIRENSAAILLPEDSLLELKGNNNKITTNSYHCNGVYCEGDLFISGHGKLDITIESMSASAIYVNSGVLSMDDKAEVTIDSPRFAIYIYDLSSNKVAVSVKDDAKVTFPDDLNGDAIYVITKKGVDPDSITFNYKETPDEADDIIALTKLETQPVEVKPEEKPVEEVPENTYFITIGNKEMKKNGEVAYTSDTAPYITNGYTMLPLRALLVLSDPNVEIKWDTPSKTATVSYNGKTFTLVAQQETMIKDTESVALSTATEIKDGRLFVSLRDWMQIMGISDNQVSWDDKTKTVTLKH